MGLVIHCYSEPSTSHETDYNSQNPQLQNCAFLDCYISGLKNRELVETILHYVAISISSNESDIRNSSNRPNIEKNTTCLILVCV